MKLIQFSSEEQKMKQNQSGLHQGTSSQMENLRIQPETLMADG